jgi:hypothetical protein
LTGVQIKQIRNQTKTYQTKTNTIIIEKKTHKFDLKSKI